MILEQHPDIQRLSASEKLALVTELWDDLAAHPADIPVTDEVIAELDRRVEQYRKNPLASDDVGSNQAADPRVRGVMDLVLLLSADIDIQQAYEYYEDYQEGRGAVFMRHLDAALNHLTLFPHVAPIFHGEYRRLLVPHYPYGFFLRLKQLASW